MIDNRGMRRIDMVIQSIRDIIKKVGESLVKIYAILLLLVYTSL